jgi:hypothetical protein
LDREQRCCSSYVEQRTRIEKRSCRPPRIRSLLINIAPDSGRSQCLTFLTVLHSSSYLGSSCRYIISSKNARSHCSCHCIPSLVLLILSSSPTASPLPARQIASSVSRLRTHFRNMGKSSVDQRDVYYRLCECLNIGSTPYPALDR